jgi:hypothetical protein
MAGPRRVTGRFHSQEGCGLGRIWSRARVALSRSTGPVLIYGTTGPVPQRGQLAQSLYTGQLARFRKEDNWLSPYIRDNWPGSTDDGQLACPINGSTGPVPQRGQLAQSLYTGQLARFHRRRTTSLSYKRVN